MCGICGIIGERQPGDEPLLWQMCRTLAHRGPDDVGYYVDSDAMLGSQRLAIIDLVTGHQPLTNSDRTLTLVFNGEIYNYRELRADMERQGRQFRTNSDSEVILQAYEMYGIDCLSRFNGIFAFAIWDAIDRRLFLARDRLGVKPLYYWTNGSSLIFASELKALITHPLVPRQLDWAALDHFLTLEYIPAPLSIFEDIRKLPAGHWLLFQDGRQKISRYWDIRPEMLPKDENACVERLRELIQDAVRLQLVSDVPVGAFLSGGIDSSTVVATMSEFMTEPVQTFSIGFGEQSYDELPYARTVAARFQTKHNEEVLKPEIAPLVERLAGHLDEPLADSSIVPTYLVSEMAARSVKVVLTGDGGDELFGGYDTYLAQQLDRYYRWVPAALRRQALPALLKRIPPSPEKKGLINKAKRFVEGAALPESLGHARWMIFLGETEKRSLYASDVVSSLNGDGALASIERKFRDAEGMDHLVQQQYVDIKTYLADDILAKVDRMSMAASLEARVPLLDHRLVEFALSLPPRLKLHRWQRKVILRKAMRGRLPESILTKPKQGFSIPLKHWLRGPLLPLLKDLLSESSVRRRGYFRPATISGWVRQHLDGHMNHSHRLWALMLFEFWMRKNADGAALPIAGRSALHPSEFFGRRLGTHVLAANDG